MVDGAEVGGFDKDPTHDPPVHGHCGPEHRRVVAPELTLKEALDRAWEEASWWAEQNFGASS